MLHIMKKYEYHSQPGTMTALGKYPLQLNKFATIMYNNLQKFHRALLQQLCIEYQLIEKCL